MDIRQDLCSTWSDPRWSRVEETFGEDPVLTGWNRKSDGGRIRRWRSHPYSTWRLLKHFLAYGISESGQNGNPLLPVYVSCTAELPAPFRQAIDAGALSGNDFFIIRWKIKVPGTANHFLLTELSEWMEIQRNRRFWFIQHRRYSSKPFCWCPLWKQAVYSCIVSRSRWTWGQCIIWIWWML